MRAGLSLRLPDNARAGSGPAAALDLDFTTGVLPAQVVFSRVSNATQLNAAGILINAPHNYCPYSQDFSQTGYWGGAVGVSFSAVSDTAPDGTASTTVGLVNFTASPPARFSSSSFVMFTLGQTAALSVWARTTSGTKTFRLATYLAADAQSADFTATTTWQRFTAVVTPGTNAVQYFIILNGTSGTAGAIEVWGAQIEQNSAASIYIPTTTFAKYGPRLDYDPPRLNYVRNNTMQGVSVGAPGTLPTNWSYIYQAPNVTCSVAGTGVEFGMSYVDISIVGNSSFVASEAMRITPETGTAIPVVLGQTWTGSWWYRLVGGSLPAGAYFEVQQTNRNSGGGGRYDTATTVLTTDATLRRGSATTTIANATSAYSDLEMQFENNVTSGAFSLIIRLYQPQLELSAAVTASIPTYGSAVSVPVPKGLLVEAASTNQVYPSINWVTNATASGSVDGAVQSAATAPDGTTTAEKLIPGSFLATHQWIRGWSGAINTTYTASVYVKAAGWNYALLSLENSSFGASQFALFNLLNGTISAQSANSTGTIQALPNGWYRISVQSTSLGTVGNYIVNIMPQPTGTFTLNTTGDAVSGVLIWGHQVEAGYATTSYIATTTTIVTRALDTAYVPVVGLQGINGDTGSLFAQMIYEAPSPTLTYARWIAFNDGTQPDVGTEWGIGASVNYPTTINGIIASTGGSGANSALSPAYSAGSAIRYTQTFNTSVMHVAFNTVTYTNISNQSSYIPRTMTVLNLTQRQRYQNQASLWFQHVTYNPAYLGPNWATNKANGSIP